MNKIFAAVGRLSYAVLRPLANLYLRFSSRAYILISCDDEILVVKNWFGRQRWHLPGGGIRRAELPAEAAVREAREELGMKLEPAALRTLANGIWQTPKYRYQIFSVNLGRKPDLKPKWPEVLSAQWLKLADLNKSNAAPEILAAIKRYKQ